MVKQELQRIRQFKRTLSPYVKNFALDLGIMAGSSIYTKFIVLGRSRVGSNFLLSLLNSHSQVVAFEEILSDSGNADLQVPEPNKSISTWIPHAKDPVRYLEQEIFRTFPEHIRAVGFKLFYYHARNQEWKHVWSHIRDQQDIKVIHLKRRNILKTHLSRKKAVATDAWVNLSGTKETSPPVTLSYEECLRDFVQTRTWEEEHDAFFRNHPKIEVVYENLAGDYAREMQRIQEFLNVKPETTQPMTYKQASRPLSQDMTNYFDLKEKFRGTEWAEFFEE